MCLLLAPGIAVSASDKSNFENGNYNKLSSEALDKQTTELKNSLASSESSRDGWTRKLETAKAEEEGYKKESDEINKERKAVQNKLDNCKNSGEQACSEAEIKGLNKQISEIDNDLKNLDLSIEMSKREQAGYEKNVNYNAKNVEQKKQRLADAQKEVEKRKTASVEAKTARIEEVPASSVTDGVLPPPSEPVTIAAPKESAPAQTEIIGLASSAKTSTDKSSASSPATSTATATTKVSSSSNSSGGLFGTLLQSGVEIFKGMRQIIFAVAGFGIMAVAIGGFFGNLNWKWLSAIIIGLMVTATASAIINYIVDYDAVTDDMVTDTLISAR